MMINECSRISRISDLRLSPSGRKTVVYSGLYGNYGNGEGEGEERPQPPLFKIIKDQMEEGQLF